MNTGLHNSIVAHVDQHAGQAVELVRELVRVPSDNPPGDCAPHARTTKAALERLGFRVEAHEVPAELARRHGMISVTNLVVRHRFGPGPVVALNAHGDVVPPGSGWTTDPFGAEIRDGWLYGRGAAVSKSDIATYAYAVKALLDTGTLNRGTIELHFTYDEEAGGHLGPAWLLAEKISSPDYAVCAAFSHAVVTAHNGRLHIEVTVRGKSAHVAWAKTGVDAIEGANAILTALYRHQRELAKVRSAYAGLESPNCLIGLISGGTSDTVVPDEVRFHVDRRILPDESPEQAEADVRRVIEEAARSFGGIRVEISCLLLARPFVPVAGSDRLAEIFCAAATSLSREPVLRTAIPISTDARHYGEAGVPTIMYGAGPADPLEANGHRANERVPLYSIPLATKVVATAVCELILS